MTGEVAKNGNNWIMQASDLKYSNIIYFSFLDMRTPTIMAAKC